MTPLQILKIGRRRVSQYWTQGVSQEKINGKVFYCATGACQVGRNSATMETAMNWLAAALPPSYGPKYGDTTSVVIYNDRKGRKRQEIVRLYDRAIAKLEKQRQGR